MHRLDATELRIDTAFEGGEAPLILAPAHEVTPRLAELATMLRAELAVARLIFPT